MRSVIRTIVVFLVAAACAPRTEACSCLPSGPPCQNLFQSDAVFVGTVTGIRPMRTPETERLVLESRIVAFNVEKGIRGINGSAVDVRTGSGGGDCGFDFKIGERYVVYAYRHPDGWLRPDTGGSQCGVPQLRREVFVLALGLLLLAACFGRRVFVSTPRRRQSKDGHEAELADGLSSHLSA